MSRYVFVVDDDIDIRESVTDLLEEEGYRVESADNGRAALDRLALEGSLPCVIVLDLMMPIMCGQEFREHQLDDSRLAAGPVIVMSASYKLEKIAELMRAQSVITKPTRPDRLLSEVHRLCESNVE